MDPSQRFKPNYHEKFFSQEFPEERKGDRRNLPTPAQNIFKASVEIQNQNVGPANQVSAKARKFTKKPLANQKVPNSTVNSNLAFLEELNADLEKLPFFKEKQILLTPNDGLLDLSVFDVGLIPLKLRTPEKFSEIDLYKSSQIQRESKIQAFEKEFLKRLRKPLHINEKDFQTKIREFIVGIYLRVFLIEGVLPEQKPNESFLNACWEQAEKIHIQLMDINTFADLVKYLLASHQNLGFEIAIAASREMVNYDCFKFLKLDINFDPSKMVDRWLREIVSSLYLLGKKEEANYLCAYILDFHVLNEKRTFIFTTLKEEEANEILIEYNKKFFQESCLLIPKGIFNLTFDPQTYNVQRQGSELISYPKIPSLYFTPYTEVEELEMVEWEKAFLKRVRTTEINLNSQDFKEQFIDFVSGVWLKIVLTTGKIPLLQNKKDYEYEPLLRTINALQELMKIDTLKFKPKESNEKFFFWLTSLITNNQVELAAAACRYLLNQYKINTQENFNLASFKTNLSLDKFFEKIVFILIKEENYQKALIVLKWMDDETIKRPLVNTCESMLYIQKILQDDTIMLIGNKNILPETHNRFWDQQFENYLWVEDYEKMKNIYNFEFTFLKMIRNKPAQNISREKKIDYEIDYYSGIWLRLFFINKEISKVKLSLISSGFFNPLNKSIIVQSFDKACRAFSKLESLDYDDHKSFRKLLVELIKNDQFELAAATSKELIYYDIKKMFYLTPEKSFDAEAAIQSLFAEAALPPKNLFEIEEKEFEVERKEGEPNSSNERNLHPHYKMDHFSSGKNNHEIAANLAFLNQLHTALNLIEELKYLNLSLTFEKDRLIFPDIIPTFSKCRSSCFPWQSFMYISKAEQLESNFIKRIRKEPIFIHDPNFQTKVIDFYSGVWLRHCLINNVKPDFKIYESNSNPVYQAIDKANKFLSFYHKGPCRHLIIDFIINDQLELAAAMIVEWFNYKMLFMSNLEYELNHFNSEDEIDSFFEESALKSRLKKFIDYVQNKNIKNKILSDLNLYNGNHANQALISALTLVSKMREEKKLEGSSGQIIFSRSKQISFLRDEQKLQKVLNWINIAIKNGIPDAPTYLFDDCKYGLLNAEEKLKLAIDSALEGGFKTLIWYLNEKNPDIKKLTTELPKNGNFAHRIIFYRNLLNEPKPSKKRKMLTKFFKNFPDQNIENLKIEISNIQENDPRRVIKIMNQLISKVAKVDCTNNNVEIPLMLLA